MRFRLGICPVGHAVHRSQCSLADLKKSRIFLLDGGKEVRKCKDASNTFFLVIICLRHTRLLSSAVSMVQMYPSAQWVDRSWVFDSPAKEASLKPICERVEMEFELPTTRLCRYFAGWDDDYLIQRNGRHFRGFHATIKARNMLPRYLFDCFFHPLHMFTETVPFDKMVAFDNLIYIRQSTCDDLTGLVECYAHELQHVVQRGRTPRLSAVNGVLYDNLKRLETAAIAIDVPAERDANIVAKRVAERVCGVEAVRSFAERQCRLMEDAGDHEERGRWIFFRDTPCSTRFDLLAATLPLVEKYKDELDFGMDVDKPGWWDGPQPPPEF